MVYQYCGDGAGERGGNRDDCMDESMGNWLEGNGRELQRNQERDSKDVEDRSKKNVE